MVNTQDPCMKTFPVYKQFVTKCEFIPSKCFNIKSYQFAVKSQQLDIVNSINNSRVQCTKSCPFRNKLPADPSGGFELIEYADKCCSGLNLPSSSDSDRPQSKCVETACCKCCDKSVNCDLINVPDLTSKPAPNKPPCMKSRCSSLKLCQNKSCSKEVVLCSRCKEKRAKRRPERCHCKTGSIVYYSKKCEYGDHTETEQIETNKYKCRYLDLIHRIKCIFTKKMVNKNSN